MRGRGGGRGEDGMVHGVCMCVCVCVCVCFVCVCVCLCVCVCERAVRK